MDKREKLIEELSFKCNYEGIRGFDWLNRSQVADFILSREKAILERVSKILKNQIDFNETSYIRDISAIEAALAEIDKIERGE